MNITFIIQGFHCDACIRLSTMKLKKIAGVQEVNISGLDGKTEIQTDREISLDEIRAVFQDTEYTIVE